MSQLLFTLRQLSDRRVRRRIPFLLSSSTNCTSSAQFIFIRFSIEIHLTFTSLTGDSSRPDRSPRNNRSTLIGRFLINIAYSIFCLRRVRHSQSPTHRQVTMDDVRSIRIKRQFDVSSGSWKKKQKKKRTVQSREPPRHSAPAEYRSVFAYFHGNSSARRDQRA